MKIGEMENIRVYELIDDESDVLCCMKVQFDANGRVFRIWPIGQQTDSYIDNFISFIRDYSIDLSTSDSSIHIDCL